MPLSRIRAGSQAFVRIKVYDMTADPPVLFNPATSVKITIRNPSGVVVVNEAAMTNVSTGVYTYKYQSSSNDPVGAWTVEVKTTDSANIVITEPMEGWQLV